MTAQEDISEALCRKAALRIAKALKPTPLLFSEHYSHLYGRRIYFKLDNRLFTGSFKERGAFNFLLSLSAAERKRGVCAASAGNHALALSFHARALKVSCTIVMPVHAPLVKAAACKEYGARVISHGESFYEAERYALEIAKRQKLVFAPAFDDARVICGQASAAYEILEQLKDFDLLVVPVGGGGLISGLATVIKKYKPKTHILGVQSEWAYRAQRSKSKASGALRPLSIADGIAIKQIGKLTAPVIKTKVDSLIRVGEADIAKSVVEFLQIEKMLIEGAAAAAVSALRLKSLNKNHKRIVVFISGSNIDTSMLMRLIERDMAEQQKIIRLRLSIPDRPGSLHALTRIIAGSGINILQVSHDRSFSRQPGNVEVTLMLEVKDKLHKNELLQLIKDMSISYNLI